MRVSMSATGSVSIFVLLPGALGHPRDHALMGELTQTDPAEPEFLVHGARAAALVAAAVVAHLVLRGAPGLRDQRFLRQILSLLRGFGGRERKAEAAEQRLCLLVRLGCGRDRDVEAADLLDAVVVDLGEDDLLPEAERVVPAPVERLRAEPAEVADPGQRDRDEPVEEL